MATILDISILDPNNIHLIQVHLEVGLDEFCWQNFEQNREVQALSIMPAE